MSAVQVTRKRVVKSPEDRRQDIMDAAVRVLRRTPHCAGRSHRENQDEMQRPHPQAIIRGSAEPQLVHLDTLRPGARGTANDCARYQVTMAYPT